LEVKRCVTPHFCRHCAAAREHRSYKLRAQEKVQWRF
jgi:hypothetical protein